MHLRLFRSLWTNGFDLDAAIADVESDAFDGIEGPAPSEPFRRRDFAVRLSEEGIPFIGEIALGGGYVPRPDAGPSAQLAELEEKLEAALDCNPVFVTILAGRDAWPLSQSVDFFGAALELIESFEIDASFETHRSRSAFNPWVTRDLLMQLPKLHLTCDFSHWCCVCERLVLDEESEILELCAGRTRHVHARVGHDQGPQVGHPAAPEYRLALAAHERWWEAIWTSLDRRNQPFATMTPEFGPDGYQPTLPYTQAPVANLDQINRWMAERQRQRFQQWTSISAGGVPAH